jgi:hypothetical protein
MEYGTWFYGYSWKIPTGYYFNTGGILWLTYI